MGGISERGKEIKRRRHRRKKLNVIARKLKKATASERSVIGDRIRQMTTGSEVVLKNFGLAETKR